jgi:hypothetical protein
MRRVAINPGGDASRTIRGHPPCCNLRLARVDHYQPEGMIVTYSMKPAACSWVMKPSSV